MPELTDNQQKPLSWLRYRWGACLGHLMYRTPFDRLWRGRSVVFPINGILVYPHQSEQVIGFRQAPDVMRGLQLCLNRGTPLLFSDIVFPMSEGGGTEFEDDGSWFSCWGMQDGNPCYLSRRGVAVQIKQVTLGSDNDLISVTVNPCWGFSL